jgi:hypothetical protein
LAQTSRAQQSELSTEDHPDGSGNLRSMLHVGNKFLALAIFFANQLHFIMDIMKK